MELSHKFNLIFNSSQFKAIFVKGALILIELANFLLTLPIRAQKRFIVNGFCRLL